MVENFDPAIPQERFLECIHCGLCTSSCPTYLETRNENDSPRGRIQLMRAVVENKIDLNPLVKNHLDLCLDCRACESACPSGVRYSQILEPFRHEMEQQNLAEKKHWWQEMILKYLFPSRNLLWWSVQPAIFLKRYGMTFLLERTGLLSKLPVMLQQMIRMLPDDRTYMPELPEFMPAKIKKRASVALFLGCAGDALYRDLNWLTAKVLQYNGCDVYIPRNQTCCGAINAHSGNVSRALAQAEQNQQVFNALKNIDVIITNVAGCGAQLKEYYQLYQYADRQKFISTEIPFQQPAEKSLCGESQLTQNHIATPDTASDPRIMFGKKVRDITEFLIEIGPEEMVKEVNTQIAYHPACHLTHAQKIKTQPLNLLKKIPGLKIVPFQEQEVCCGAAGSYNLTETEMAEKLGERKFKNLSNAGIDGIVMGNIGCMMQLSAQAKKANSPIWIRHTIELIAAGYGLTSLPQAAK